MLYAAFGGLEPRLIAAQAVVQHAAGIADHGQHQPLASYGRAFDAGGDERQGFGCNAAPGGEDEPAVHDVGVAGCECNRVCLLDGRRCSGKVPAVQVHPRQLDDRGREDGECAVLPRQSHGPGGERVERVVVPKREQGHDLDDRIQQEPAHRRFVTIVRLVPEGLEREP